MPAITDASAVVSLHFQVCMAVSPLPSLAAFELAGITSHPRYGEVLEKFGKFSDALGYFPNTVEGHPNQELELANERLYDAAKDFYDLIKEVHSDDVTPEAKSLMLQLLRLCQLLNLMKLALICKR